MPGKQRSTQENTDTTGRSIGELAGELGVQQHILRYWETRFPQLKPVLRAGNLRYYRPQDVAIARRIHRLLNHDGYTIRGVQRLLGRAEAEASTPAESLSESIPPEMMDLLGKLGDSTAAEGAAAAPRAVADEVIGYQAADPGEWNWPSRGTTASAVFELLGGSAIFGEVPDSALDVHDMLAQGIPARALIFLMNRLRRLAKTEVLERALAISLRTYQRREDAPDAVLSTDQGARLWKFAEILAEATELFGSADEAETWLGRPAIGLDQRRPIDLLATPAGIALVEDHLGRLRYGVYA